MDSALQQTVTALVANNCLTLVILIVVGYDYILTFSDEIEYIWKHTWTHVSTLFVLVRYFGLFSVIIRGLLGSTFLPVPAVVSKILYICSSWAIGIFILASDLAMMLRVCALYSRSRLIFGLLSVFLVLETVAYIVSRVLSESRSDPQLFNAHVLGFSFCNAQFTSTTAPIIVDTFQITLGALLCLLASIRFIRELLGTRGAKQVRLNHYIKAFTKEGIFYFFAILSYTLFDLFGSMANPSFGGWISLLGAFQYVPAFTLAPRFILSLRKLYALDRHGRRGSHIDTAFGFTGFGTVGSQMLFAQNNGLGCDEGVPMDIHADGVLTE